MTPSEIRDRLACGSWEYETKHPPAPPQEWSKLRQAKLHRKIRAAMLFLQGNEWSDVCRIMKECPMTRQRAHQLISGGCDFFISRNWVRPKKRIR